MTSTSAASVAARFEPPGERTLALLLAGVTDKRYRYVRWASIATLDQILAVHSGKGAKPWPADQWNAFKARVEEVRKSLPHEDAIDCHCSLCASGHRPPHQDDRDHGNEHATTVPASGRM